MQPCSGEISEEAHWSTELIAASQALTELESHLHRTETAHEQAREQLILAGANEARCVRQAAALSREAQEFRVLADEAGERKSKLEAKLKIAQEVRQGDRGYGAASCHWKSNAPS